MPDQNKWDERYLRGEHTTQEPSPLLIKAIRDMQPGRALDSACGVGRHALYLAERGWQVTAVDSSRVGIEILRQRASERNARIEPGSPAGQPHWGGWAGRSQASCRLEIDAHVADLEKGEFHIEPAAYDLICDFYYLQRDLFSAMRAGVKPGGAFVAAIHLNDGNIDAKPNNPAFLLEPGELKTLFSDWKITYYHEGPSDEEGHHHDTAYLIARKPLRE
jgi:SAM-dependent methyltransferase